MNDTIHTNKPDRSEIPDVLYKYRFFDTLDRHLSILTEWELWFTSAREFNDPYDSVLQFDFTDHPKGIMQRWAMDLVRRTVPNLSRPERRRVVKSRLSEIRATPDYKELFHKKDLEHTYRKFGICSLSAIHDDLLMWAHYSHNHSGFCVGLRTEVIFAVMNALAKEHELLLDIVKIDYSDRMPQINFFQSMLSENRDADIIKLLSTKSTHWSYEKEYRLTLWERVSQSIRFLPEIIDSIFMGCRISPRNRDRILDIAQQLEVPAFEGTLSSKRFEILFNQVFP